MSKIRVLHVIKSLGRGGAEMLLPETLRVHDQTKFEFYYIFFLPWKDQMASAIEQAGGRVFCFSAKNNLMIALQFRRLAKFIQKNQIDLVHCHLPWAGLVGRLVRRILPIPVIYTEHNKQERYHWVTALVNRCSFNWQSMVIAVSGDVKESIVRNINPRVQIEVVYNGVDTQKFSKDAELNRNLRGTLNIPLHAVVVGSIAVFRTQKRLIEWLEVVARVAKIRGDVYFILVGDGPLMKEVRAKGEILGLRSQIFFPGLQEDVRPWLSAMDIFMMTSQFEGMPVALLEAMSAGCAVASTDAGGIKEVVRNNIDGKLVSVDEWQRLEEVVLDFIDNTENVKKFGERAHVRVTENFSMGKMVERLESIYQNEVGK